MKTQNCFNCKYYSGEALLPCAVNPPRATEDPLSTDCADWDQKPVTVSIPKVSIYQIVSLILPLILLVDIAFRIFYPDYPIIKHPSTERYEEFYNKLWQQD